MDTKKLILWIVIAILAIAIVYVVFFKTSGTAAAVSGGKIDTTGWTENEKMNYEMHGTIPARVGSSTSSGSGMVGGC
ncbi:MAG: hypothetical protein WC584_00900 [Candidatus Pacearchaeota archaeon]